MEPLAADIIRLVLLLATAPVAMLAARFGYVGWRKGVPVRAWGAAAFLLLLAVPTTTVLLRFGEPLQVLNAVLYAAGLVCGVVTLRTLFTLSTPGGRVRMAAERDAAADRLQEKRATEDVLRADDRELQAGERADSREAYDAGHTSETAATHDRRVEAREAQDENREHSHGLQDDERDAYRSEEDRS